MTTRHRIRRRWVPETGRHVWRLYVRRHGIMGALRPWEHISSHATWRQAMTAADAHRDRLAAAHRWADQWNAGNVPLRVAPPTADLDNPAALEHAAREHHERMARRHG